MFEQHVVFDGGILIYVDPGRISTIVPLVTVLNHPALSLEVVQDGRLHFGKQIILDSDVAIRASTNHKDLVNVLQ